MTSAVPPSVSARARWLVGAAPDLLLGCGLGHLALIAAVAALAPDMARVHAWIPFAILVTGVPHYGATLLRVYGTAGARRRYAWVAWLAPLCVWSAFVVGTRSARFGSALITLYLSWSPWHYAAQNYGLGLALAARRGATLDTVGRRLWRASYIAATALVLVAAHRAGAIGAADPVYEASHAYRFVPLGIPDGIARVALVALALAYLATTTLAAVRTARAGGLAAAFPSLVIAGAQALWFLVPLALGGRSYGPGGAAALAFTWVALAHSVQYLWVSVAYVRATGETPTGSATAGWLARATLVGAAAWVVPAIAFAPGALGHVPFDLGLGLLVAAAVNLHHFLLDGAIWKLRDARVGAALVAGAATVEASPRASRLGRSALYTVGALAAACWVLVTWERAYGERAAWAAGDPDRLSRSAAHLALAGRDGPRVHVSLARLYARAHHTDDARRELERSLALAPTTAALDELGRLDEEAADWQAARAHYRAALAIDPDDATAFERAAVADLRLEELAKNAPSTTR